MESDTCLAFPDDPHDLTPAQRLAEVAAILAAGYLRLNPRPFTENPLDSSEARMAVSGLTDGESGPVEAAS